MNSISGPGFSHYSPMSYQSVRDKSERRIVSGINMPVDAPSPVQEYAIQLRQELIDARPHAKIHVHVDRKPAGGIWEISANIYSNGQRATQAADVSIAKKLAASADFKTSGYKLDARFHGGVIITARKVVC